MIRESRTGLSELLELGYGHCRVSAAVPMTSPIRELADLDGSRVATSHAAIATSFFSERGIGATVVTLRGSVEVAPKLGVADAIIDLVSTGSTLVVNGLREVGTLLESQAVLVGNGEPGNGVERIVTAVRAVVAARAKRYVVLNAPEGSVEKIATIIPGLEAPTVVPLAEEGWVAVHSVVDASEIFSLLPLLQEAGGEGILVLPITQVLA